MHGLTRQPGRVRGKQVLDNTGPTQFEVQLPESPEHSLRTGELQSWRSAGVPGAAPPGATPPGEAPAVELLPAEEYIADSSATVAELLSEARLKRARIKKVAEELEQQHRDRAGLAAPSGPCPPRSLISVVLSAPSAHLLASAAAAREPMVLLLRVQRRSGSGRWS
jgi:hypothetical protein